LKLIAFRLADLCRLGWNIRYIYAEDGLSRERVSILIYEGQLRIEYRQTLLAHYRCAYDERQRRLLEVSDPTVYVTDFSSKQLELIELDNEQWLKVQLRPPPLRTQRFRVFPEQLSWLGLGSSALILLVLKAV